MDGFFFSFIIRCFLLLVFDGCVHFFRVPQCTRYFCFPFFKLFFWRIGLPSLPSFVLWLVGIPLENLPGRGRWTAMRSSRFYWSKKENISFSSYGVLVESFRLPWRPGRDVVCLTGAAWIEFCFNFFVVGFRSILGSVGSVVRLLFRNWIFLFPCRRRTCRVFECVSWLIDWFDLITEYRVLPSWTEFNQPTAVISLPAVGFYWIASTLPSFSIRLWNGRSSFVRFFLPFSARLRKAVGYL